jgi:hypothetical protein
MDDSILRKHIRKVISEFFNNAWVYTYGPNKFPKFDDEPRTPSDLEAKFDSEFDSDDQNIGESEKNDGLKKPMKKVQKKSNFPNKH